MTSILIELNAGTDDVAKGITKSAQSCLREPGLEGRTGVVGPLSHPASRRLSITVWAHNDIDVVDRFFEALTDLFRNDGVCRANRHNVSGLPDR